MFLNDQGVLYVPLSLEDGIPRYPLVSGVEGRECGRLRGGHVRSQSDQCMHSRTRLGKDGWQEVMAWID